MSAWKRWLVQCGFAQPKPWGRDLAELTISFTDPAADGLVKDGHGIRTVVIRPVLGFAHNRLERVRRANRTWLAKWESTLPPKSGEVLPSLTEYRARADREMAEGRALNMMIEVNGEVAGSVSIGSIQHSAMSLGTLGYWIARKWANKGIMTLAVAAVIDLALTELGLHRIEVVVRPENKASIALCRKLRLHEEGLRIRYMHIAGAWCDHLAFIADQEMLLETGHSYVDRI